MNYTELLEIAKKNEIYSGIETLLNDSNVIKMYKEGDFKMFTPHHRKPRVPQWDTPRGVQ